MRNQRHQDSRELRKQANRLEKQWEAAEADVADLQRQLADPAVYGDPDKIADLGRAHDARQGPRRHPHGPLGEGGDRPSRPHKPPERAPFTRR